MNKGFLLSLITLFSFLSINAQEVSWPDEVLNTGSNSTYLIQSANIDGSSVIYGYVLGAFFVNDEGNLQCGGFTNCSSNQVQLAVMGDDTTTDEKDGFYDGEEITWLAYGTFAEQTYTATVDFLPTPPYGSNTFSTNGLNIVTSFNISSAVLGCVDLIACNYNANATENDNTCTYAEENLNCDGSCIDTDGDLVCDTDEINGCTDTEACNFNELATESDDSCTYPEINLNCEGDCLNDVDEDGVCDENEVSGCSDETACNYDLLATENDGSCTYTSGCESCENFLIIDNDIDNDSICDEDEIVGCTDADACNYMSNATDENNSCIYATGECDSCSGETNGTGFIIDNDADNDGVCNDDEEGACVDPTACNYNSNPTYEDDNSLCIFTTGSCDACSGDEDGTGYIVDNDLDNDGVCDADEIEGCTNSQACNYNASATDEDNSCEIPTGCETCSGELDGTGIIVLNDIDNDGVCDQNEIVGCTDVTACNYNENATDNSVDCAYLSELNNCNTCSGEQDGTGIILLNDIDGDFICDEDEVEGCSDATACNYNENATDQGICIYIDSTIDCQVCSGETDGTGIVVLNDTDLDGVCDDLEIFGCTNPLYTEYNAEATEEDNSCSTLIVSGCTDSTAFNYDQEANTNDNNCLFDVLVDFTTTGTNTTSNYSVTIDTIDIILGESELNNGDLIGGFYLVEGQLSCAGFTTWTGNDFSINLWMDDPATIEVDGVTENTTVYWIVQQEATMFNYLVDLTLINAPGVVFVSQISLNTNTVIGCMDTDAYNYNSNALIADGACEEFIEGCTDADACNYDEEANTEDGTCYIITATIPEFQSGQALTVVTDAANPTFAWFLNSVEQGETSNEFTPYVNGLYSVEVTDENGCTVTATYNLVNIGIEEVIVNQLSLYPNPAERFVEISSTHTQIETLKLYSITGQLLQTHLVNARLFKVERNDLPSGIYFIQATIKGAEVTKRLLFK